ncbi:MAG: DUF1553 domain-containing protein [Armatimonadetes bacterium]|nr:DUF1553 domain-containing protein [Armatimonadota bacterium]MDE2206985.1 DUF1553 domain-containing protein [Armatimonadota bacterium]
MVTRNCRIVPALTSAWLLVIVPSLAWPAPPRHKPATRPKPRPAAVEFNRDIRPILQDNCFTCHGPDHMKRQAGLRLDLGEAAMATGVIVPFKPAKSQLISRIFSSDPAQRMPPQSTHKTLTAAQKSLIYRWVAQGARFQKQWSFVPLPAVTPVPTVKDASWCRTPIDRFVLARLERKGIKPSPEAPRAVWLRRVSYDLIGLPPTPQEITAFQQDRSPRAYATVVDRLLANPQYGEHAATAWLDIARYADSYGYQSDLLCPTWPYRDWVVKAYNTNLPYSSFVTWQLAGDLLPHPTRDQRLATAFNRLHRMTNEGGSVAKEWRIEGVADRVKTFGTAFVGLTLECARCHDHKFDPISQRDYYSLCSFFNNIDEYGLYNQTDIVPTPSMLLPTAPQQKQLDSARAAAAAANASVATLSASREQAFLNWLQKPEPAAIPDMTGKFDFADYDGKTLKNLAPGATQNGERDDPVTIVPAPFGKAARFTGDNDIHFPQIGAFTRTTPFTIAFRMLDPRKADGRAVVFQACDGTDVGFHGYDLMVLNGILMARIYRYWPGNAIAVQTRVPIPANTWTHVAVTYDGSSRASGLRIYLNGAPASLEVVRDHLYKGTGKHTLVFAQRFRDRGFEDGEIGDIAVFSRDLSPVEVAQLSDGRTLQAELAQPLRYEQQLRPYYLSAVDPTMRQARAALAQARQSVVTAENAEYEIAVMQEMPTVRPTYVLARGVYDAAVTPADLVTRELPATIYPFPRSLPRNRLGLAEWLLLPNHPLTARVEVNRLWAQCFGTGLVETAEDFGVQGKMPTHPHLLDWLARHFISSGWNMKAMLRMIVLSSTYRQVSADRADLAQKDPANALLARGPSRRLTAEEIRDTALAASGLLDTQMGGPPVSPYQPGDLWTESNSMSPAYHQSVGGDLYRRSLYTVWKRTAPMPNMLAFDAGTREVCLARRTTTNTPTQALVLLNDVQFVEAARVLGQRMLKEGGPDDAHRIAYAFLLLTARHPSPAELRLLEQLYTDERGRFQRDTTGAARLIHVGESKPDPADQPAELAAATIVAQTIMNLDATVWER